MSEETIDAEVVDVPTEEIEEEKTTRALVEARRKADWQTTVDSLVALDPSRAIEAFKAREEVLTTLRLAAVRATRPLDWTLSRDKEGREVATLRKSGASILRKYYGISIFDIRPVDPKTGAAYVEIVEDEDKNRVAQVWGSARSAVTGEEVFDVRGVRAYGEQFTGRGTTADLCEAARTSMETKIIRILSGTSAMPIEELEEAWQGTSKSSGQCYRGHGYGGTRSGRYEGQGSRSTSSGSAASGSSRQQPPAQQTSEAGASGRSGTLTPAQKKKLFATMLSRMADLKKTGTKEDTLAALHSIAEKHGFDSLTKITKGKVDDILKDIETWTS